MRLETTRLVIRSFEPSDAEGMLQVFGDPAVRTYLPPFPDPTLAGMRDEGTANYYGLIGSKKYVAERETWKPQA